MDAIEAARKAKAVKNSKVNTQYNQVKEAILEAVNKGEFQTYFYYSLLKEVKERLETELYTVKESFDRNEVTVTISFPISLLKNE